MSPLFITDGDHWDDCYLVWNCASLLSMAPFFAAVPPSFTSPFSFFPPYTNIRINIFLLLRSMASTLDCPAAGAASTASFCGMIIYLVPSWNTWCTWRMRPGNQRHPSKPDLLFRLSIHWWLQPERELTAFSEFVTVGSRSPPHTQNRDDIFLLTKRTN